MTIKEQLEHAKEYSYPVRVTLVSGYSEEGVVFALDEDSYGLQDTVCRWRDYAAIASVEPLEPAVEEADRSYPHCDETRCLQRQGGGLYCKREECDTRNIFVDYADSFREDPKSGEEAPADDMAKERWEIEKEEDGQYWRIITPIPFFEDPFTVLAWHITKVERARLMASAPEILDALINVQNSYSSHDDKAITCVIRNENWQKILDALKKSKIKYIK